LFDKISSLFDKIPSVGDTIIAFVAAVLAWLLVTGLSMWAVQSAAYHTKRAKSAIKKDFPYFTYPFYKKMFFMGLKGALSGVNLVIIWGSTVFLMLYIPACIVLIMVPCRVTCAVCSVMTTLCYGSTLGRMLVLRLSWPDFKQANIKKK